MPIYKAPLRDMQFVMKEVIGTSFLQELSDQEDFSDDLFDAVLTEAARFCEAVLFPLNQIGDRVGCIFKDGMVTTPPGFKEAYEQFVQAGWPGLSCSPTYGGQGLPETLSYFVEEMFCSSNISFGLYPGLTRGAYNLLSHAGSEELKSLYLPRLASGIWGGTMCLTEPHCGTDLGLLRTKAIPQEDGTYRITGTKIFISSGEHDLTDNIIHFVIARTPEAPEGIKGISLFLVPKFKVNAEGNVGERNGVVCSAIEHKMGIKGSSTCVMNFEDAEGYLVGDLYHGVSHMFVMMNNERLGVGNQGLGLGEIAYQNALAYARDRLQGRALRGARYPDKPADPLLVQPDIRRMLLKMKAYTEGNRMLGAWTAFHIDIAAKAKSPEARQEATDFIQLMTPIVKAFMTDCGFEAANYGIQIMGGHGYITEYGMEQFARDARITQIYEGANGIQALDLLGRKVGANMGRSLRQFFHPVLAFIEQNQDTQVLRDILPLLTKVMTRLQQATTYAAMKGLANPDEIGAASTDYLRLFALTAHAYLWAKVVLIASRYLEGPEKVFYEGKINTARFFYAKILPETSGLFAAIMAGSESLMAFDDASFGPF